MSKTKTESRTKSRPTKQHPTKSRALVKVIHHHHHPKAKDPKPYERLMVTPRDHGFWTPERKDLIRRLCAKDASPDEFFVFMETCQMTGLNPLMRQIYCIHRWDNKAKEKRMTIQVGIDGMRLIAERSGKYLGTTAPMWWDEYATQKKAAALTPEDVVTDSKEDLIDESYRWVGGWVPCWIKEYPPAAAKVGVIKAGNPEPVWGVATWREYAPDLDKPEGFMWKKLGPTLLAKCAEAQAERKAFPQELSAIYVHEELEMTAKVPSKEMEEKVRVMYEKDLTREAQRFHILAAKAGLKKQDAMARLRKVCPLVKEHAREAGLEILVQVNTKLEEAVKELGTRRGKPINELEKGKPDAETKEQGPAGKATA